MNRNTKHLPLFGVFDGHGPDGQSVSSYLKHRIPKLLFKFLSKTTSKITDIMTKSIQRADSDMKKTSIDCFNSGSTLWIAILKGK